MLKKGSHIHLMGICGTAMASLAGLLKDKGFKVTGSDSHPYPPMSTQIENLGIQIQKPYRASNLNPQPDFVIVGNVISALTDFKARIHIPYRDSKLTRLLEDSLGGNCKTTMIAMISPAFDGYSESISTLKFATRAKKIKNTAKINEDVD